MFLLGDEWDSLGGEDGAGADVPQEVFAASPDDLTEVVHIQHIAALQLAGHLGEVVG